MKSIIKTVFPVLALFIIIFLLNPQDNPTLQVRGKSPALPIVEDLNEDDLLAQDLALSDGVVIELTAGRRSEVFDISPYSGCPDDSCKQVTIYNFDENTSITVIIDPVNRHVLDVQVQPGLLPIANRRLMNVAVQVIRDSEEVASILGYHPLPDEIVPMPSSLVGTDCGYNHPCLGAVFPAGDQFLWAHVDLTTEQLAGVAWSPAPAEEGEAALLSSSDCPAPGRINRDGWRMDYNVTPSDGLAITDVSFNFVSIMSNVRVAEWHVDYGYTGFIDATGCVGGGGQSYIAPYGETQIIDLYDDEANRIGFELVQDFRMPSWGVSCNYRYDQHYQFYNDGSFRIVTGAYGRGCGNNAIYRPIIRIDLALVGAENDQFSRWSGSSWITETTEIQFEQAPPYTGDSYAWRVSDKELGFGYLIEPGVGQFGDGGLGDNAFVYVTQHHPNEGDSDLIGLGPCCEDDAQQGPHRFVNGESIDGENLVLWYIPQMVTSDIEGSEYCWTVTGGSSPETYPCFAGPIFHPMTIPMIFETWLPIMEK